MIFIFIISLLFVAIISIGFFYYFLEEVLQISIENVYIANTINLINDIIQVKKNDFMLSQHDLKVTNRVILDIMNGIDE